MTTDIVPYQQQSSLELAPDAWKLAEKIAGTDFVPTALRGKPEAVLACILAGHEAGVSPMQALAKIHIIEGRPAMSAELMRALVLRHGHELNYDSVSTTSVTAAGRRKGADRWTTVTWTMDDAKRGGLDGKQNWRRWPRAMLIARATGELCRMIFPDVLAGISHTVEELTDGDVVDGLLDLGPAEISAPAAPARATARAAKAVTRKAAAGPADVEPKPAPPAGAVPALPGDDEPIEAEIIEDEPEMASAPADDGPPIIEPPDVPEPAAPPAPAVAADGDEDWPSGEWESGDFPATPNPEQERRYTGPQIIAIKLAEKFGIKGNSDQARQERLAAIVHLIGRQISSSKDLTADEISSVCETLDVWPDGEPLYDATPAPEAPVEQQPITEPDRPAEAHTPPVPSRSKPTPPAPVPTSPESWNGEQWRTLLAERKVKVTELLREAQRLAALHDPAPSVAMLDQIADSGLAVELLGWVEDLSLERRK